jgi:hypothetical protein
MGTKSGVILLASISLRQRPRRSSRVSTCRARKVDVEKAVKTQRRKMEAARAEEVK